MPFYSFILKKNCLSSSLGIADCNLGVLEKGKKYYSKNTSVWKILNKKNNPFELKDLTFEEHVKISIKAKKIVFCLPPNPGIGDSIEYGLAIKSIKENNLFEKIGIAFCSNTYKILSKFVESDNIYSDFITDDEINQYDALFHFTTEIDSLKFQKYERENIEKCVNNYFNIKKYHPKKDILSKKISRVSIFPISKSPIRTLSVTLIEDITSYLLKRNFVVDLILGNDELTSKKYLQIFDSKKSIFIILLTCKN